MNTNLDFLPAHPCWNEDDEMKWNEDDEMKWNEDDEMKWNEDDIFCVFECLENVNKNFNFIYNLHPNL